MSSAHGSSMPPQPPVLSVNYTDFTNTPTSVDAGGTRWEEISAIVIWHPYSDRDKVNAVVDHLINSHLSHEYDQRVAETLRLANRSMHGISGYNKGGSIAISTIFERRGDTDVLISTRLYGSASDYADGSPVDHRNNVLSIWIPSNIPGLIPSATRVVIATDVTVQPTDDLYWVDRGAQIKHLVWFNFFENTTAALFWIGVETGFNEVIWRALNSEEISEIVVPEPQTCLVVTGL